MKRFVIFLMGFLSACSFGIAQTGGFNSISSSNGLLAIVVPFPVFHSGRLVMLGTPWWLLVLVFMIVFPIIDVLAGMVPPFSKSPNQNAKVAFSLSLTLIAMFASPLIPNLLEAISMGVLIAKWWFYIILVVILFWLINMVFENRQRRYMY